MSEVRESGRRGEHAREVRGRVVERAAKMAAPKRDDPIATPPAEVSAFNIANAVTVARLLLVPFFVYALFADGGRIAALVLFVVASSTDWVDGELARRRGLVTDFGKIADPIADKALTGAALVGLSTLGELAWWVTIAILVREIGITLLRFAVIRHGVIPASWGGKAKTVLQIVAIALYIAPGIPDAVRWPAMLAAVLLTVGSGIDYLIRAWRLRGTGPVVA